jgi:hypothetical protein
MFVVLPALVYSDGLFASLRVTKGEFIGNAVVNPAEHPTR